MCSRKLFNFKIIPPKEKFSPDSMKYDCINWIIRCDKSWIQKNVIVYLVSRHSHTECNFLIECSSSFFNWLHTKWGSFHKFYMQIIITIFVSKICQHLYSSLAISLQEIFIYLFFSIWPWTFIYLVFIFLASLNRKFQSEWVYFNFKYF